MLKLNNILMPQRLMKLKFIFNLGFASVIYQFCLLDHLQSIFLNFLAISTVGVDFEALAIGTLSEILFLEI